MRVLAVLAATLVTLATVVCVVFTLGMRAKSPKVTGMVRRANRLVFNPRQHDAGRPGAYASLIRHSGRTSGASYETPVVAEATEDGFVIALPYGIRTDWVQNVLAAGSATLVHEGESHRVTDPGVVSTESVDRFFSSRDRRAHRIFRTERCLRLRRLDVADHAESTL